MHVRRTVAFSLPTKQHLRTAADTLPATQHTVGIEPRYVQI